MLSSRLSKTIKTIRHFLRNFDEKIAGFLLFGMLLSTFPNVVTRYIFNLPLTWNEELSKLLFIWMVLIGSILNTRRNDQLCISYFTDLLPLKVQKFSKILIDIVMIILMFLLSYFGIRLVQKTYIQHTTVLKISYGFLYSSVPVCASLMSICYIKELIGLLRKDEN